MNQSKRESLVEALLNTLIGYIVALMFWPVVCYLYDITYSHGQNLGVTALFSVVSIVRAYIVRRYFNARLKRAASSIASNYS